jgi:hypothetical protein
MLATAAAMRVSKSPHEHSAAVHTAIAAPAAAR